MCSDLKVQGEGLRDSNSKSIFPSLESVAINVRVEGVACWIGAEYSDILNPGYTQDHPGQPQEQTGRCVCDQLITLSMSSLYISPISYSILVESLKLFSLLDLHSVPVQWDLERKGFFEISMSGGHGEVADGAFFNIHFLF